MNNRNNTLAVLLAIAVLVALGFGAFLFLNDFYHYLQTLNQDLVTTLAVILVSVIIIGFSIRRAGRAHGVQRLRLEKKAQCYERFVRAWFRMLAHNSEDAASAKAISDELAAATEQLMLWASAEVIRQLVTLQNNDASWIASAFKTRSATESVIRAMRVDLGQNNLRLSPDDLGRISFASWEDSKVNSSD